jgi:hypothetical protein
LSSSVRHVFPFAFLWRAVCVRARGGGASSRGERVHL